MVLRTPQITTTTTTTTATGTRSNTKIITTRRWIQDSSQGKDYLSNFFVFSFDKIKNDTANNANKSGRTSFDRVATIVLAFLTAHGNISRTRIVVTQYFPATTTTGTFCRPLLACFSMVQIPGVFHLSFPMDLCGLLLDNFLLLPVGQPRYS